MNHPSSHTPHSPSAIAADVVGYAVKVRRQEDGTGKFAVSVPCVVPAGEVKLFQVSRGSCGRLVR